MVTVDEDVEWTDDANVQLTSHQQQCLSLAVSQTPVFTALSVTTVIGLGRCPEIPEICPEIQGMS